MNTVQSTYVHTQHWLLFLHFIIKPVFEVNTRHWNDVSGETSLCWLLWGNSWSLYELTACQLLFNVFIIKHSFWLSCILISFSWSIDFWFWNSFKSIYFFYMFSEQHILQIKTGMQHNVTTDIHAIAQCPHRKRL